VKLFAAKTTASCFFVFTATSFTGQKFQFSVVKHNTFGFYGQTIKARASCAGGREFVSQRPAKSYTALQTVRHRFNIYASSCVALAL